MSRTSVDVQAELLAFSPEGEALPLTAQPGAMWPVWLMPLANEIMLFEAAGESMLPEVDPATATYMLPDYERVLGPDPYGRDAVALTIAQRQTLARSRWTQKWGARPADFEAFAASFGVTISITEYPLSNVDNSRIGDSLTQAPTQFYWVVKMPPAVVEFATVDASSIGDALDEFQPSLVQPAILARAPAGTIPVFNYA